MRVTCLGAGAVVAAVLGRGAGGGGRGGDERRLGVAGVGRRPQQPPEGHEQDHGHADDGHDQPVGAAPAGLEAADGPAARARTGARRALLGPVGLQQRGRVDAQVAGVGAQEALGVDAPAELAEPLALERLQVARPDPGRDSGLVERPALRFPSRAALRRWCSAEVTPSSDHIGAMRRIDSPDARIFTPTGRLRNLLAEDLPVVVLAAELAQLLDGHQHVGLGAPTARPRPAPRAGP